MSSLRILLADDHDVVRQGLRSLLEAKSNWQIVGEATTCRGAVNEAKRLRPDIVILDIGMPELNGLDAIRYIVKTLPKTEILVVTMHDSEELIRECLEAGARGYLVKTEAARHLVQAVEAMQRHKPFLASTVTEIVLHGYLRGPEHDGRKEGHQLPLTLREREIIELITEGKSSKEIAAELGISVRTAETHRGNIMHKLDLHSVGSLIRYAIRNNIVQP